MNLAKIAGLGAVLCSWVACTTATDEPQERSLRGYFSPSAHSFGFYPGPEADAVDIDADSLFISDGTFTRSFYKPTADTRPIARGEVLELLRKTAAGDYAHHGWFEVADAELAPEPTTSSEAEVREAALACVAGNFYSTCTIHLGGGRYSWYSLFKSGTRYQRKYHGQTTQWGFPCPSSCSL